VYVCACVRVCVRSTPTPCCIHCANMFDISSEHRCIKGWHSSCPKTICVICSDHCNCLCQLDSVHQRVRQTGQRVPERGMNPVLQSMQRTIFCQQKCDGMTDVVMFVMAGAARGAGWVLVIWSAWLARAGRWSSAAETDLLIRRARFLNN